MKVLVVGLLTILLGIFSQSRLFAASEEISYIAEDRVGYFRV